MEFLRSMVRQRREQSGAQDAAVKMIVGLGNPGPEYSRNRHNVGFQVVELFADRHGLQFDKAQKRGRVAAGRVAIPGCAADRVVLVKPLTFMNASGESVGPLVAYYKVAPADILAIYDDLDLPLGRLRLRAGGGAGGHKGIQSLIRHLGSDAFPRLRVGIGRPPGKMEAADYVLQNFSREQETEMEFARARGVEAAEAWLARGIEAAMNEFNGVGGAA